MSLSLASDDVLFMQRLLRAEGLYQDKLDGEWGPRTEKALQAFEDEAKRVETAEGSFDTRSEANIHTLCLRAQREARRFMQRVLGAGLRVRIISGTRSYAEQDRLFSQGRFGNPPPVVTNAKAGHSNHNFGLAWDIGVFTASGGYLSSGSVYDEVAKAGLAPALEWGGDWHGFVDKPHYQLASSLALAALRSQFEAGSVQVPYRLA